MATNIGAKTDSATDNRVPITLGEEIEIIAANTVSDDSVKNASIEIVACSNGTYRNNGFNGIVLDDCGGMKFYSLIATAINEAGTVE